MMAFEKWKDKITKTKMREETWDELIVRSKSGIPLGRVILENYLQKDGDVIEIDMANQDRRAMGNFMRALTRAKRNKEIDFLLRYNKDFSKAYIKRLG